MWHTRQKLINLYKRRGAGDYGVILTGNVLLEFQELEGAGNFILPSDAPLSGECFDSFQELAAEGRKHDALMIGPICHPDKYPSLATQIPSLKATSSSSQPNDAKVTVSATYGQSSTVVRQDKGSTSEEARELIDVLRSEEVDSTELSGGTYGNWRMEHLRESTKQREASCIEWADAIAPVMEKTYLYINGGFGTAAGMVRALDTVATVGVACIAAVEPSLPKSILSGKMKGSIRPSLDEDNPEYNIHRFILAGCQLNQVSKGKMLVDLARPDDVQTFWKDIVALFAAVSDKKDDEL